MNELYRNLLQMQARRFVLQCPCGILVTLPICLFARNALADPGVVIDEFYFREGYSDVFTSDTSAAYSRTFSLKEVYRV